MWTKRRAKEFKCNEDQSKGKRSRILENKKNDKW